MNSSQIEDNNTFSDDEIDVRQLFKVIWNDKKIIIAITSFFSIAAVIYSLLPVSYTHLTLPTIE